MNQVDFLDDFFKAAKAGDTNKISILLKIGADIQFDVCEVPFSTSMFGFRETIYIILEAESNIRELSGFALLLAAENGHVETVQVLLQAGADVHAENDQAIQEAALNGHTTIVQILLEAGANPARLTLSQLKKYLKPRFLLFSSQEIITAIEASHPQIKDYKWTEKRRELKSINGENTFDAKISLADLYYRPGETGYYRAIDF